MKEVVIYTDGACSKNPGPGGWCAILIYKGIKKVLKGFEENTTNNRMELKAIIEGLKALKEPCKVTVYTDSAYIVNAINQNWIGKWQKNNWKTSEKEEVKNIDLWQELLEFLKVHNVKFEKVKGHSTDTLNNMCDEIARSMIKEMR
ncbi:ribonuclease H [Caldicellulosiruptor saccharolyticus DSM 8903]|uniref:Ribonuclease H n=1 Tax=Caldicellulosiruptor saccharolyticus (strain ATCC 43494 / DSM 8903 / Tp8T 6331) TaxID=351627 RepID=RNH_CALS8|nr:MULTISPECIES: ribonuclease HI [Caldicellulosiruptor]A4XKQ3.1 RecName: Full=Ribonuclease H; Short=RNase H [Caldicellulosiruptor saccharolyticus DSM 8903]ABP67488.1 ribonuclease H [Caldicellulosiruptor saccharolyticus DSM 8903]